MIILHGLYGCSDNWLHIVHALSSAYTVYAVDLRNHGHSPHFQEHTYNSMALDVMELIHSEHLERPILLGHSMGGKVVMNLLAHRYGTFRAAMVADIAPIAYAPVAGNSPHMQVHMDMMRAMMSVPLDTIRRREEADVYLADAVPEKRTRLFLLKNLYLASSGHFSWRLNLPVLAQALPHILNGVDNLTPLSDPADRIPMLFLKGEQSAYIGREGEEAIRRLFPQAELATVLRAGHWLHFEQPEAFLDQVMRFLRNRVE